MVIQPQPLMPANFPQHLNPHVQFQKSAPAASMAPANKPTAQAGASATPPSHSVHSNMALYLNQFGKNSAPQPQQPQQPAGQPSMASFMSR